MPEAIISVSELNLFIKNILEAEDILQHVAVRGELSNYKIYPSGHHYFTLKDAEASVRCVLFKSSASKLRFRPENGMRVTVTGRVSVYPRDGAYQLYATNIIPEGVGDLQLAFEQLRAKLEAEGLFSRGAKKPLPPYPQRVAVITSGAGAAVHDIIRVMRKRWPLTKIILLPVRVQGAEAPAEIAGAIRYANRYRVADVIITGRGGGSLEDLWAFNDERVARAIFASELPVISAVGHEPDVTISDYVADCRAATPSNAAELVVPDREEVAQFLDSLQLRAEQAMQKKLREYRRRLTDLQSRPALSDAGVCLRAKRLRLDMVRADMERVCRRALEDKNRRYTALAAKLDALSPLKVIGRGYSVAEKDGAVLRSVDEVRPGEKISLRMRGGKLDCMVEGVYHDGTEEL